MTDLVEASEPPVGQPAVPLTPAEARRAVIAASIGNGLEFYDFVTFAFFAIQIGNTFFPKGDPFLNLMAALATFGAGFITRPLGAYILGGYADRVGRKPAMLFSMMLMGIAIAVLALTPSYATIGIAAPILAILARLAQGFALGGEVGCATTYLLESATVARRGFMISWQGATQQIAGSIGALVGIILSLTLTQGELDSYGWRIALLLGVTIVPYGLWIRRTLPEPLHAPDPLPVANDGFRSYWKIVVLGGSILACGTITSYIFNYMATYGQATLKLSTGVSMTAEFANNAVGFFAILLGGALSDRYGRRLLLIGPQTLFIMLIIPCFMWLTIERSATSFIGANIILSFCSNALYGVAYACIAESLPRQVRARAFALIYSVPVAVFGGTTQLVVTWLLHVTGNPMSIAWYLAGVSLFGLGAMLLMAESAPVKRAPALMPALV